MHRRHELTDHQWEHIAPLVPRHGRRSQRSDRDFINSVLWILKTGSPWRDLPERYGNWKTVFNRFSNWARSGHWERIFAALRLEKDEEGVLVDATIARAHQDASGGKGGPHTTLWDALEEVFRASSTRSSTPKVVRSMSR